LRTSGPRTNRLRDLAQRPVATWPSGLALRAARALLVQELEALMETSRWRRRALIVGAALVGVIGALTYAAYRPSLERARARISTGSRIAASRCGPIEYGEMGEGPPILVVHGAGGGFDQGLEMGEGLARAGFRVIAPSRFGYLRTPLPADGSAEAQADAHACLLDALGIGSAAVIGVSAGAPSVLQLALRHPDRTRALLLLVPAVYAPPRPDRAPPARASHTMMLLLDGALRSDFLFWAASQVAHDTFVRSILGTPPELVARAPAEEQARIEMVLDHILPVSPRRMGLLNDARVVSSLPRYDLERIAVPTLAISTADDLYGTFAGARYTAEHIPHARFIGYPSGGHMLVGRNAAVSAEIVAVLKAASEK
jgi:pimeloyl-ACP methyl ester carboxylesterase